MFAKPHFASVPGEGQPALGDMDNDGYTDIVSDLGYVAYGEAGGYFPTTISYPIFAPGSS